MDLCPLGIIFINWGFGKNFDFLGGIKTCKLTYQKLVKNWSNDRKNLDELKLVRLKTQTGHIDVFYDLDDRQNFV